MKELRGGGLRIRESPGEFSQGPPGRGGGDLSGGVPGSSPWELGGGGLGAPGECQGELFRRSFQELKRGVPLEPKNSFPLRRWRFFGRFQTPLQPQPELQPQLLFIYPRLLGRIQVPGVASILQNNQDTQDPQHAGDPSYLGVVGLYAARIVF